MYAMTAIPNLKYTFQQAFAEILPHTRPSTSAADTDRRVEFTVPGWDVTRRLCGPPWRWESAVVGEAHPAADQRSLGNPRSPYDINSYLAERGDTG